MPILSAAGLSTQQLQRTLGMPEGGPKCVPIRLDFSVAPSYSLDYSNQTQLGYLDMCQTVWVDNYGNAQVLSISVPGTQQTIQVPAGAQGYFPILCPNPIRLVFSSTGTTVQQVTLLNFPVMQ